MDFFFPSNRSNITLLKQFKSYLTLIIEIKIIITFRTAMYSLKALW